MEIIFRKRETLLCRVVQNKNNLKWPQVILPNMEYDHKFKNMAAFETKARIAIHGGLYKFSRFQRSIHEGPRS